MELGLSLGGDASKKPFGFLAKISPTTKQISNNPSKGFCMALGISLSTITTSSSTRRKSAEEDTNDEYSPEETIKERSTELILLPLAPLHHLTSLHQQSFPWSSDNGNSEGGSSGNVPPARAIDVNRLAAAAAEDVSSPNSSASSFRMDLGIYRGGNKNRRDLDTIGNDAVEGDGDENGLGRKKLRLSKQQSAYLEESFEEHNTLNPKQKLALAEQLNLRPRQVEVWFQNRRARTKLKQTEVDCEYLKRCCETLTEENRKLHKELQELRSLKSSNLFNTQVPATTLTMCPSCERLATTSTSTAAPATTTTTTVTAKPTDLTISIAPPATAPLPFPGLSRPKFYPFPQTPKTNLHQSAAS